MTGSPVTRNLFARRWWVVLLRGVIAVIFGLMAFAWPHLTIATLALLFGLYALIHGISSMFAAVAYRPEAGNRLLLALEGVVGIWAGIITLRSPTATAMVLIFFVWVWAIATGVLRIAEAIRIRKAVRGEVWLAFSGVVTVAFGLMLFLRPVAALIGLAWVIAAYALLLGLFEILQGLELRTLGHARLSTA